MKLHISVQKPKGKVLVLVLVVLVKLSDAQIIFQQIFMCCLDNTTSNHGKQVFSFQAMPAQPPFYLWWELPTQIEKGHSQFDLEQITPNISFLSPHFQPSKSCIIKLSKSCIELIVTCEYPASSKESPLAMST